MKKQFLFPLALSLLLVPVSVKASVNNTSKPEQISPSEMFVAGFLDGITEIKESVEDVRDTIDTTNETTTDTIDEVHGINEGVGDSKKIVEGGGESQESNVIEKTQLQETTETVEDSDSNSF